MKPTLVILAAGAGSRYGGMKQLASVGSDGEPLLEYSAHDAIRSGFGEVVVVVDAGAEGKFRAGLSSGLSRRVPLTFVHQALDDLPPGFAAPAGRHRPWGTVQAVLAAERAVVGPFAVVNADDFYGAESFEAMAAFLARLELDDEPSRLAVVGFKVAQTLTAAGPVSRAVCRIGEGGLLAEILEIKQVWRDGNRFLYRDEEGLERSLGGDEVVSMNMWGFSPSIFAELRARFERFLERAGDRLESEFLLPDVVRELLEEGRVVVEVLPGSNRWCGMTFREDRRRVREIIGELVNEGLYSKELWT